MGGKGTSNPEIKRVIENSSNDDFRTNFVSVFAMDEINYIHNLVNMKHHFLISNVDRADRPGTHLWSILDLHPKKEIFLHGEVGLQNFLIQVNKK